MENLNQNAEADHHRDNANDNNNAARNQADVGMFVAVI
jgi:hypothetical protein